jgi:hypothetical protein
MLCYVTLHCIALHCITLHYITYLITSHHITLRYVMLRCTAFQCITFRYVFSVALHCVTLYYVVSRYVTWLCMALHYTTSYCVMMSRDSLVCIATGYGLDDRMIGVRFPVGAGNFSLLPRVQTGSGTHPASYPLGTGGSFPGCKAAGAWSWPLTSI